MNDEQLEQLPMRGCATNVYDADVMSGPSNKLAALLERFCSCATTMSALRGKKWRNDMRTASQIARDRAA